MQPAAKRPCGGPYAELFIWEGACARGRAVCGLQHCRFEKTRPAVFRLGAAEGRSIPLSPVTNEGRWVPGDCPPVGWPYLGVKESL